MYWEDAVYRLNCLINNLLVSMLIRSINSIGMFVNRIIKGQLGEEESDRDRDRERQISEHFRGWGRQLIERPRWALRNSDVSHVHRDRTTEE